MNHPKRFSRAAGSYEQYADVQRSVAEELFQYIPELSPKRVLDVGCGTGLLTRKLRQLFPESCIVGIDISPGMLQEARRLQQEDNKTKFLQADMSQFCSEEPFQLIASSAALHWCEDMGETVKQLSRMLAPGGVFALASMLRGTLGELHELRKEMFPDKLPQRELPSFQDLKQCLSQVEQNIVVAEQRTYRTSYESVDEVFRVIRHLGVTGGALSGASRPLQRREIQQLKAEYAERYSDPRAGVSLTYNVGFCVLVG